MNSGRTGTEGDTEGTWWPWDHQRLGRGPLIRSRYPKLVFTDLLQVAKPDYMPRIPRCEFTTPKAHQSTARVSPSSEIIWPKKKKLLLKEECGPAGIRWGGEGPSGGQGQDLEPCTGSEEPQTLSSSKYCSPLNQPPFAELSLGQTLGSAERAEGKAKVPVPRELTMVKE